MIFLITREGGVTQTFSDINNTRGRINYKLLIRLKPNS